jgi:aminobenzoyl-glutamate utilization protein B
MPNKPHLALKCVPLLPAIRGAVADLAESAIAVAERIAELAEPGMGEFKSSATLAEFLAKHGFVISHPWRNLPTAFKAVAQAGRGGPTIAILAEYDALPDCGDKPGQWGHGCGHNLLGAGAALAGIAAAQKLRRAGKNATVIVFGCPAEETLSGKVYMAMQGAFANLDAVLAWHPVATTKVNAAGGSAMDSIFFRFAGKTAHGASAWTGRSALDGVLLMDVAVNYLREHVEPNTRLHSVITHGGRAPNVVPDSAEIWYYVRGRDRKQVDELRRRVIRCAEGAATATETEMTFLIESCITERLRNQPLADLFAAVMRRCGPPKFTAADVRLAAEILPGKKYNATLELQPDGGKSDPSGGSSDEDNVSWFAPLNCAYVACVPDGAIGHHREWTRACRASGGHRGMLKAAEYLAASAVELILNRPLLARAQSEFRKNLKGKKYELPKMEPRTTAKALTS